MHRKSEPVSPNHVAVHTQAEDVLPRASRRVRRPRSDRGLPPDEELQKLARAYLERQRKNWPQLVKAGYLPEPTPVTLAAMAEDFKARHRTGVADPATLRDFLRYVKQFAGSYNRFSCDNSDPKSIIDQMVNGLDKAHGEGRFVPWLYVFCDYSVSGLDASRQGYRSYKAILEGKGHLIETTYIDDFTRASRDELEWWQLAALSKRLGKRLIGSSDNFNLADPNWDVWVTIYGLLSRLFIKSLRQKVKRGMIGTARTNGTLGLPPLGFTRRVKRDENGNVIRGPDGEPKTEPCIDEPTKAIVHEIYELFVVRCWTPYRIARDFCRRSVNGWQGWTDGGIRKVLRSPAYMGVFIWNRTRREIDFETKKRVVIENPRREWQVCYNPALALVPREWWKTARRKLGPEPKLKRRDGGVPVGPPPVARRAATTLFSGTLVCGYCGRELRLYRSCGRHKDLCCMTGRFGVHGCQLTTSKAVHIVEECLLRYIGDSLFSEAAITDLVRQANLYLAAEGSRPRSDATPLRAKARKLEARIQRLVRKVEESDDQGLCEGYDRRIKALQKELNEVRRESRDVEHRDAPAPAPLDLGRVKAYLADLRGVLGLEVPAAAEALRALTGPVTIRQEAIPGRKRGATWVASFTPNLLALLAKIGAEKDSPDSLTLEYLNERIWSNTEPAVVTVRHRSKYEQMASNPTFLEHLKAGRNPHAISRLINQPYELVVNALAFVKTGKRPQTKPPGRRRPAGAPEREPAYIARSVQIARLKDGDGLGFAAIAKRLDMTLGTVERAYWFHHRDELAAAARAGQKPPKAKYSRLGYRTIRDIQRLHEEGVKPAEIAAKTGSSPSTVYRVLRVPNRSLNASEGGSDRVGGR